MEKRAKYAKLHPEMSNLDLTKILSKKYKELPEKKKMKYIQDFQREKQEFERNLARFREDHPDLIQNAKKSDVPEKPKTPQQLWYNHEKKIYLKVRPDATTKEVKESLGKQWSQLSDKKRLKWIHKALEQRKEYEEIMRDYIQKHPELNLSEEGITRSTLTKAERQLKDKFDGRPTKPPPNSYSLYCAELMANMKDVPSTERMVLCSQQWKLLSQKEKDAYHKKCDQKKKDYEIELLRFLESLPEEEQQRVLGEEKMLGSNRKGATSPASKKSSPETGKASSEKPKRPISAMFIFSEEKRKQLQEERPELSESELTRLLARMWNDLSEKKKAKYKAREAAMKAQSEKKHGSDKEERGKLPESPKTAEEIWQQSVIGDYLARFKVGSGPGRELETGRPVLPVGRLTGRRGSRAAERPGQGAEGHGGHLEQHGEEGEADVDQESGGGSEAIREGAERDAGPAVLHQLQEDEVPGRAQETPHVSALGKGGAGQERGPPGGGRSPARVLRAPAEPLSASPSRLQERLPEVLPGAALQRGAEPPAAEGAHGGDRQPLAAHLPGPEGPLQEAGRGAAEAVQGAPRHLAQEPVAPGAGRLQGAHLQRECPRAGRCTGGCTRGRAGGKIL
uniref:Upstream binding transcription factor n=1 Tax=Dromaius novaehollandiae TaxID=8790 RepID=A0A8C4JQU2_DRONO